MTRRAGGGVQRAAGRGGMLSMNGGTTKPFIHSGPAVLGSDGV